MGTIVSGLALLISLAAVGYAWKLQQELQGATRRLDRYNRALYSANDDLRQLREELRETKAQLRVELMQSAPGAAFTPATTVREAQLLHDQAAQVLAGYHLGGCSSCAVEPDATLAQICQEQGRDLTQLLVTLNGLRQAQHGQTSASIQPLKLPNVELAF
jgi:hypothetical protein